VWRRGHDGRRAVFVLWEDSGRPLGLAQISL